MAVNDPYSVLGVDKNASPEEIKKAYKELVKKYHPDRYHNNPLADLAEEKLREVNEAYSMINNGRTGGSSGGSSYGGASSSASFQQIRSLIQSGQLQAAESMLNQIGSRGAEWFFLKGIVCQRRGMMTDAVYYARQAATMEPGNAEYVNFLNSLTNMGGVYRNMSYQRGYNQQGGPSTCDCCSQLICADCCCECMGGDLIACC